MNFLIQEHNPAKKTAGAAFAVLFHVALIYALATGLGTTMKVALPPILTFKPLPDAEKIEPPEPPPLVEHEPKKLDPSFVTPSEVFREYPLDTIAIANVTFQPPQGGLDDWERTPPSDLIQKHVRIPPVVDAKACERPDYPSRALREGLEGLTVLEFLIGADGKVMESKVARSSGVRELDNAALAGLSRCMFKAGTVNGKPEQSWTKIQYVWKIE